MKVWRYLSPAVFAALIFAVLPMLYTMSIGFTNYSSRNLLGFEDARDYLSAERLQTPQSDMSFTLLPSADINSSRKFVLLQQPGAEGLGATRLISDEVDLADLTSREIKLSPTTRSGPLDSRALAAQYLEGLRALQLVLPEANKPKTVPLTLASLTHFAQTQPLFVSPDGKALVNQLTGVRFEPDLTNGVFVSDKGEQLQPGFRVNVGLRHYTKIFTDERFRAPFISVLIWTIVFSLISVFCAAALGMILAVLLDWEDLRGRSIYRVVLFLPYAIPGFISILVFKGLFNQNLGEINVILGGLFGIKPQWFSDPLTAKIMLVIVNVWLGFPYMMVLCAGLIKTIPEDLYEASAIAGAGTLDNFFRITLPLTLKPLTPLLISAFAFNFNNFVLINMLTKGRPDQLDAALPAGTTDILVSYTWRIAFEDSGQQFGLAAAISTVIFIIVAVLTLLQMRLTKVTKD
jgi:maltose/maltodextrin transport system permease protein